MTIRGPISKEKLKEFQNFVNQTGAITNLFNISTGLEDALGRKRMGNYPPQIERNMRGAAQGSLLNVNLFLLYARSAAMNEKFLLPPGPLRNNFKDPDFLNGATFYFGLLMAKAIFVDRKLFTKEVDESLQVLGLPSLPVFGDDFAYNKHLLQEAAGNVGIKINITNMGGPEPNTPAGFA